MFGTILYLRISLVFLRKYLRSINTEELTYLNPKSGVENIHLGKPRRLSNRLYGGLFNLQYMGYSR